MFNSTRTCMPRKLHESTESPAAYNQVQSLNFYMANTSEPITHSQIAQAHLRTEPIRSVGSIDSLLSKNYPKVSSGRQNTEDSSRGDISTSPTKQNNSNVKPHRSLRIETQSKLDNQSNTQPKNNSNTNASAKLRSLIGPTASQTSKGAHQSPVRPSSPQKSQNGKSSSQQRLSFKKENRSEIITRSPVRALNSVKSFTFPDIEHTRCSKSKTGVVEAYAANTNQGIFRNYNEDRVAILLNIAKPPNNQYDKEWPVISFFGVYDGHGGAHCADFLRDNLHQYDKNFPSDCVEALKNGFAQAEKQFLERAQNFPNGVDCSGSCANVALIVGDDCYIANVGDSRSVLSRGQGKQTVDLSRDHKPSDDQEKFRIFTAGGTVHQQKFPLENTMGPARVYPGGLSVSRTIGDIEAKVHKYGGIPGVVSAEPEIKTFKINREHDFIVLASDGVYDTVSSEDLVKLIWGTAQTNRCYDIHSQTATCVETIVKEAMLRKSMDNVTVVMISLSGFSRACFPVPEQEPAIAKRPANSRQLLKRAESFSGKPATPKMTTHAPRTTLKTPEKPNSTQPAKTGDELLPTRTLSLSNSISTIMKPSSPGKGKTTTISPTRYANLSEITLSGMKFFTPQSSQSIRGGRKRNLLQLEKATKTETQKSEELLKLSSSLNKMNRLTIQPKEIALL